MEYYSKPPNKLLLSLNDFALELKGGIESCLLQMANINIEKDINLYSELVAAIIEDIFNSKLKWVKQPSNKMEMVLSNIIPNISFCSSYSREIDLLIDEVEKIKQANRHLNIDYFSSVDKLNSLNKKINNLHMAETLLSRIYAYCIDDVYLAIYLIIERFIGQDEWKIYTRSKIGNALLIEKGKDFRIWDWEKRYNENQIHFNDFTSIANPEFKITNIEHF